MYTEVSMNVMLIFQNSSVETGWVYSSCIINFLQYSLAFGLQMNHSISRILLSLEFSDQKYI